MFTRERFVILLSVVIGLIGGITVSDFISTKKIPIDEIGQEARKVDYPLNKYSIPFLQNQDRTSRKLSVNRLKETKQTELFTRYSVSFTTDDKNVSGLMNIPNVSTLLPLVVLIRGYVDQNNYTSGEGTIRVGEYLASNGFITIAPDFLGYADSDTESSDIFESRFQTYTTVLDLLASLKTIPNWDGRNLFIWGHSNGGHISLAILEITKQAIPTVLWAPVSKPFPYSVLYYTDESNDGGKFIRKELSKFESLYDVDNFTVTNYFDDITAPIQVHQGTFDDAVPLAWTDSFVTTLRKKGKDVDYKVWSGADHNLNPSWSMAVEETLQFFNKHLTQ